jgi:cyclomaltodextrinase
VEAFLPMTFVGNHDVTRIASQLTDPRHLGHALSVLFTVAGTPSVYYGDEQGFRALKEDRAGGDDAVRPAFPDTPSGLAPEGWPVYRLHQQLIALRRATPWLARARTRVLHLTNRALAVDAEPPAGHPGGLTLLLNLDDQPYRFPVEARGQSVAAASDLGTAPRDPLLVPAHGWNVLTSS